MGSLVETLQENNYLRSEELVCAFDSVSRSEFLPEEFKDEADADIPLPIGHGQMVPQPSLVAVMLELLETKEGQRVLVMGSGSGWVTGLIAYSVGHQGKVIAFERIEELHTWSQRNLEKFDFIKSGRVECFLGEGQDVRQEDAPFDRILILASVDGVPDTFRQRLVLSGKMVMPIRNHLCYFEKRSESELYKEEFPGFFFVPLILRSF